MFGAKEPPKIWLSVNEEFNDKCKTKTAKHGGGPVMVWGCIAASFPAFHFAFRGIKFPFKLYQISRLSAG